MAGFTEQERQAFFQEAVASIDKDIRAQHGEGGVNMHRIGGWFRNKFNAFFARNPDSMVQLRTVVTQIALMPLNVPLLRPIVSAIAGEINKAVHASIVSAVMKGSGSDDPHVIGEWMMVRGAEKTRDAIRKLDDAAVELNKQTNIGDCEAYHKWLWNYCYWKFRWERLNQYKQLLQVYVNALDKRLAVTANTIPTVDRQARETANKIYGDWKWHYQNCRGKSACMFPWDKFDLSQIPEAERHVKAPPPPGPPPLQRPQTPPMAPFRPHPPAGAPPRRK